MSVNIIYQIPLDTSKSKVEFTRKGKMVQIFISDPSVTMTAIIPFEELRMITESLEDDIPIENQND